MAISNPTKRQLAQRYMIKFSGGMMTDDVKVDERFFIDEINQAIAVVAKASFNQNSQVEGITYAGDEFITTYRGISIITSIDNEFSYSPLPDMPIGLPKGRGLVTVIPPLGSENSIKLISLREVPFLFHLPKIPKVIFGWLEGGSFNYHPKPNFGKVTMKMITSGVQDLDTPLTLPPDVFPQIWDIVKKSVVELFKISPDELNDGQPD